jgi:hypothetical protein
MFGARIRNLVKGRTGGALLLTLIALIAAFIRYAGTSSRQQPDIQPVQQTDPIKERWKEGPFKDLTPEKRDVLLKSLAGKRTIPLSPEMKERLWRAKGKQPPDDLPEPKPDR